MYSIWDFDRKINGYEQDILERSFLPEYRWVEESLAPDDIDVKVYDRLANIREKLMTFVNTEKNNIVICGKNSGCGKTSWAIKLLLTFIEQNANKLNGVAIEETYKYNIALFISLVTFLVESKQFKAESKYVEKAIQTYYRAKETEFVVFDDVSAVTTSNYDYNILYSIVEHRVLSHLPSVFTTNCTSEEEIAKTLGPRLADRIWNNSIVIEFKGKGFRGSK